MVLEYLDLWYVVQEGMEGLNEATRMRKGSIML